MNVNKQYILFLYWSLYGIMVFLSKTSCSFVIDFYLKSSFSVVSTATPAFFLVPFVWKNFFHPLTFSLCVSLALKWVSCRLNIDESCFFIQLAPFCLLMGTLVYWYLKWLLIGMCFLSFSYLFYCFLVLLCYYFFFGLFPCGLTVFFSILFSLVFVCLL